MSVYFSNKQEILFGHLKKNLFSVGASPFSRRIVIVPSRQVESWLRLRLAEDLKIGAGIETLFLDQAVNLFLKKKQPSALELELRLEQAVSEEELLGPYLKGKEKRVFPLCQQLASLFRRYLNYGFEVQGTGWQERVWQKLFPEGISEIEIEPPTDVSIHLFSFSHLTPFHFSLFQKLGGVFFYHLSPCQEFWSDMETDREIGKKSREAMEEFLEDRHPLLASFGKVGRAFAAEVEERGFVTFEDYETPQSDSALAELQRSMLLLKTAEKKEDDSLQLHLFPNTYREIEGLFHNISSYLSEKKRKPSEIIVMAPDISLYEPLIHAFFKDKIPYRIDDLPLQKKDPLLSGLLLLLDLEKRRWSTLALLEVFTHPLFRRKMHWSDEAIEEIREWILKGNIRWGFDKFHVEQILGADTVDGSATWKEGGKRLLLSLATGEIPLTSAVFLGEWLDLIHALFSELKPLHDGKKRTFGEWRKILEKICENYLEDGRHLFSPLEEGEALFPSRLYAFSFIFALLNEKWAIATSSYHGHQLEAIRFCSLHPMRGLPAKAIFLLGMDQESFPRVERSSSLDLMKKRALTRVDFDRFLFLEALLSGDVSLFISAVGELCSPVLTLLPYIPERNVVSHPTFAFDASYFDGKNPLLKNTSEKDFRIANRQKATTSPFFHIFAKPSAGIIPSETSYVEIKDLSQAFQRPLKYYLEKKLGLYLRVPDEIKEEEEFLLSPLQLSHFRKEGIKRGIFPSSAFHALACTRLENEREKMEKMLFGYGLKREDFFSLQFSPNVKEMRREGALVLLPSVRVGEIEIVGKIENVTTRGLFLHEKCSLEKLVRHLPAFLVLNAADRLPEEMDVSCLLFGREEAKKERFFAEAKTALQTCVEYYFALQEAPSLLFPSWIEPILEQDEGKLKKAMSGQSYDEAISFAFQEKLPEPGRVIEEWFERCSSLYEGVHDAWF